MDSKSMRRIWNSRHYGVIKTELGEARGTKHSAAKKWYKRMLVKMARRYGRAVIRHET